MTHLSHHWCTQLLRPHNKFQSTSLVCNQVRSNTQCVSGRSNIMNARETITKVPVREWMPDTFQGTETPLSTVRS